MIENSLMGVLTKKGEYIKNNELVAGKGIRNLEKHNGVFVEIFAELVPGVGFCQKINKDCKVFEGEGIYFKS